MSEWIVLPLLAVWFAYGIFRSFNSRGDDSNNDYGDEAPE